MTAEISRFGIIIGAQKCATSALFHALANHPEIAASRNKEPDFFTRPEGFSNGQAWYLEHFPWETGRHRIALEASTSYTMYPDARGVVLRMRLTGWSFRFVYVIRDPVDRIRSLYLHAAIKREAGVPHLEEVLHPRAINWSRYHQQLLYYRGAFDRGSILVLTYDDLKTNPSGALARVFDHFGVARNPHIEFSVVHAGTDYHRTLLLRELMAHGPLPRSVSLKTVHEYLSTLSADEREAIEARARAHYTLTDAHREQIHRELADDMYLLHADYGIDVAKWGFKT